MIAVATEGDEEIREAADHVIYVPPAPEMLVPILEIVPLQLLAYHTSRCAAVATSTSRGTWRNR
jgi:glucosamine 6-phosphate synthetase-like amidotransferase/phosphosugar isomerase protein